MTEDINNVIRIIKSQKNLGVLIDGISKTVKHEIKKQEGGYLGILLGTWGASMLGNVSTGIGGDMRGGKILMRAERGCTDPMDKIFCICFIL